MILEENSRTQQRRLPLPVWCYAILGVPTFYMPLAYSVLALWAVSGIFSMVSGGPPDWLLAAIRPALYTTFALWPVYISWVCLSKRLTWREKGVWLFIVIMLNMLGMPLFYVFMIRRYLGIEGRMGKRDEASLDHFLGRHGIPRERLSPGQVVALRSYCRQCRLSRWSLAPLVVIACLMLYTALFFVPTAFGRISSNLTPTRTVIIDSAADTKKVLEPDPETIKRHVQMVMMFGAMAGVLGTMGLYLLLQSMSLLYGNFHGRALIEVLKAGEQRSGTPSG